MGFRHLMLFSRIIIDVYVYKIYDIVKFIKNFERKHETFLVYCR